MKRFLGIAACLAAVLAVAPLNGGAAPPASPPGAAGFSLSPSSLSFSALSGCFDPGCYDYQFVTVATTRSVVIQNPATFTGDIGPWGGGYMIFGDTQGGTCWSLYEALGNPIPAHTSCTIEVGFHPPSVGAYSATMTVSRCTSWHLDPTYGFILCDTLDGSKSVDLTGTGT
jgi:hypothetical protein